MGRDTSLQSAGQAKRGLHHCVAMHQGGRPHGTALQATGTCKLDTARPASRRRTSKRPSLEEGPSTSLQRDVVLVYVHACMCACVFVARWYAYVRSCACVFVRGVVVVADMWVCVCVWGGGTQLAEARQASSFACCGRVGPRSEEQPT